jgi:predicted RNA-binding Zn ribbon-like protein
MSNDWRDGFLFLGNHLALDFLNTKPEIDGRRVEMLPDAAALARWLAAAGLLDKKQARRLGRRWSAPEFATSLNEIHRLRERLRKVVLEYEAGRALPAGFVNNINRLLDEYPYVDQVVRGDSGFGRRRRFAPERPEHAFAPLADAIADLLTGVNQLRVRKCPHCLLHFYDISKKGTRRWCSMSMCGNRSKVAAFAGRKRAEAKKQKG